MNNTPSSFWHRFAEQANGLFIEGRYDQSDKVIIDYKGWKIAFDNYTLKVMSGTQSYEQTYTRVTTSMKSMDDFKFEIYPQNIFNSMTTFFGGQDIAIGDIAFDKKFIIKSNNETAIKQLLLSETLKIAIEHCPHFNLQISDQSGIWGEKLPVETLELAYFSKEKEETFKRLNSIGEIFKLALNRLYDIHSIRLPNV